MIHTISTPQELRPFAGCAFVPTMGALHEGHLALIRRAKSLAPSGRAVVVSIFVNPTQFGPGGDFNRYPRDLEGDLEKAESAGANVAFVPSVETVYPPGEAVPVPPLPDVATRPRLEDAHRPGHFAGVCQVVARLFDLVQPGAAILGEKDWQQLKVIEAMVRAEPARWPGLSIVPHATVREADGLALSSRNVFLSKEERACARGIPHALNEAQDLARSGWDTRRIEERMRATLVRHHLQIDYAVVRDAETLMPVVDGSSLRAGRALIAARIGSTRLIDNAAV